MDTNSKQGAVPGALAARTGMAELRFDRPFRAGSLLAERPERVVCGQLEIDRSARRAALEGTDLHLTERECALLLCLADRANRVVHRSDVLSEVWRLPDDDGSNLVAVYIRRLRQKLGAYGNMIVNVRGIGYRLRVVRDGADAADVRNVAGSPPPCCSAPATVAGGSSALPGSSLDRSAGPGKGAENPGDTVGSGFNEGAFPDDGKRNAAAVGARGGERLFRDRHRHPLHPQST